MRLEVEGIFKAFSGRAVLEAVSLSADDGEFVAVVGPSGCGKSTLLQVVAGLLAPDRGEVRLVGVGGKGPHSAVVFQDHGLFPWRRALENVAFGLEQAGMKRLERLAVAREKLALVGLAGFERHYPSQLSGGMRQRAAIARALAVDPPLLLMDEPFSALDAQTRRLLQLELARLHEGMGKTTLFITHALEEAVLLADRVVVLSAHPGRVAADLAVGLPRPRGEQTPLEPRFRELVDRIWGLIRDQVAA